MNHNYFDTLQFNANTSFHAIRDAQSMFAALFQAHFLQNHREEKIFVSKHVYVVNLDPTVITLTFGATIDIHDTVRYNRTRWRSTALVRIISFLTGSKGVDFIIETKTVLLHQYSFITSLCCTVSWITKCNLMQTKLILRFPIWLTGPWLFMLY